MADDELIEDIRHALGTDLSRARGVALAFERFVAEPLDRKFAELRGIHLAKRNPFMYAALGADDVETWGRRVLADMLPSAAEGLVGNWIEEVARIMCGGVKPGSGADLQRDISDRVVELYAIQTKGSTKNAGGARSDRKGLDAAAGALRAQRREVHLFVGYIFDRQRTTQRDHVTHLSSADFWERITGDRDFASRLLHACNLLAPAYRIEQSMVREAERIIAEAKQLFGSAEGGIDWQRVMQRPLPSRRSARGAVRGRVERREGKPDGGA